MVIAFHKPFGVVSQFTPDGSRHRTLADFDFPKGVYPIGRLDAESEGLLLLSDEPELNARLLHPRHAHARVYWAQVERIPDAARFASSKPASCSAAGGRYPVAHTCWTRSPTSHRVIRRSGSAKTFPTPGLRSSSSKARTTRSAR
jgi:23S rRNA pseudouridine2457 synthase